MDRHDEPHRAAGGLGPGRRAHARGAAARRDVQAPRQQDLHHLRRARLHRQHRAPRARAHAGRAGRDQGHLALRRAQVPGERRWQPRCAQRRALRVARAQARHPREPDGGPRLRRSRRRGRPHSGRGESRPRIHVRDDEPRAFRRRDAGCGSRGSRVPARRHVRARARAGTRRRGHAGCRCDRHHRPSRRAADAD